MQLGLAEPLGFAVGLRVGDGAGTLGVALAEGVRLGVGVGVGDGVGVCDGDGAGFTSRVKLAFPALPAASVTVTVTMWVPTTSTCPVISPVAALIDSPDGSPSAA